MQTISIPSFKLDRDIYLCGTYIWCEDSPAYGVINTDFFDLIENDIDKFDELGSVFICGDFNSRTGLKNEHIVYDKPNDYIDYADYVPDNHLDRASLDKKCNNFVHDYWTCVSQLRCAL